MAPSRREPDEFPISGYGRQRLVTAALRLFDEHGIDGVSARAIAQEAGHRNVAAVNYHFGCLEELVRATLDQRLPEIDRKRTALLDELEASGDVDPKDALRAMLTPMIDLLDDADGRRHVRLMTQAANHPEFSAHARMNFIPSLARGAEYLAPLVAHVAPERFEYRVQNTLGLAMYALAEHSRLIDAEEPSHTPLDRDAFVEELLDELLGVLRGGS